MSEFDKNDTQPSEPVRRVSPLEEQIGAVVDVYPTDPRGQEVMAILEEAFADNPPGIRTAKWIDNLPATLPPAPPDIEPTLPPEVLFHDIELANAHWEAFQQRNPRTAAFFIRHNIRPTITEMPGDEGEPFEPKYDMRHGKGWSRFVGRFRKRQYEYAVQNYRNIPEERHKYLETVGEWLLLADFMRARGGMPGRDFVRRYNLVSTSTGGTPFQIFDETTPPDRHVKELHNAIAYEFIWPWLDQPPGFCGVNNSVKLSDSLSEGEFLGVRKWMLNNDILYGFINDRNLILIDRLNAYVHAGDYGGMIICCYALEPSGRYLRENITLGFRKRFGEERGNEIAERYFELVEAVKAQPFPCRLWSEER